MKFLLVLASFIVLSNATSKEFRDGLMEKLHEFGTKCIEEIHPSDDDIAELLSHKIPPTSHEGKCMVFCVHKSFNMMTEDGNPNTEGTLELLAPLKETDPDIYEKSVKVLETCNASLEKDDDPCITATNWAVCGIKEAKTMGLPDDLFEM
nr:odorant binding protein 47 [Monochamus saltuarius]